MFVIISIPAFNEEKTLPKVLKEIKQVMSKTNYNYKILVYDDGSRDKTSLVAKKEGVIVRRSERNRGLAETFKAELKECLDLKADVIVHTDADGQYPAIYIPKLLKKFEEGYDLVLGSRFKKGSYSGSFMKKIGNIMFSRAITSLTKLKITDSTTGFRAFSADVARDISYINTFTYTQEQIIKSAKQKFKIGEIPITTRKTRESRLFKGPIHYAIKAWINIFRIYRDYDPLKFFGVWGLLFILLAFLIGIYFVILHLTIGIAGHIGLFFLMVLFAFTGLQILLFGFLADMMRK